MVEVKTANAVAGAEDKVFNTVTALGHEQVLFCSDPATGLKAIIGVHNTTLGPALGGTRMWEYASDLDALTDVLRLSRGMTFKAAISGLNLGGGKAVIIGNPRGNLKSEAFMRRFGKFVDNLGGKYITAEDVGTNTRDMEFIKMETEHVTGIPESMGGSGDPSPVTAYGTYLSMKASMKKLSGNDSLSGKKVVVQGVGNVGYYLVGHLVEEGAQVFIHDIYQDRIDAVLKKYKATVISADAVYNTACDIYSPNALGATVNADTIPQLNCSIVCGAANNQLKDEVADANRLVDRGILYAPDFAANAGGLINVYTELEGYDRKRAYAKADGIYQTILNIYQYAEENKVTTAKAAIELAQRRIDQVGRLHLSI